jgi:cysteine desulfuration protein SufE
MRFDRLVSRFQAADRNTRLETLLDFSKKLPPLPERYQAELAAGAARVQECQTPVYLWMEVEGSSLRFFAEVPRESPTVRGYVSLLLRTLDGATPAEVAEVPDDLLERLRLVETLGMMRVQGLTAILARVKRLAEGSRE